MRTTLICRLRFKIFSVIKVIKKLECRSEIKESVQSKRLIVARATDHRVVAS